MQEQHETKLLCSACTFTLLTLPHAVPTFNWTAETAAIRGFPKRFSKSLCTGNVQDTRLQKKKQRKPNKIINNIPCGSWSTWGEGNVQVQLYLEQILASSKIHQIQKKNIMGTAHIMLRALSITYSNYYPAKLQWISPNTKPMRL